MTTDLEPDCAQLPQLRVLLCSGCPRTAAMASLSQLTEAAKKAAKANGFAIEVARSACLSGCSTGPTALLESDQGVVRLQAMVDSLGLSRAVAAAATLISPAPVPAELRNVVLSRLLWAQLEDDQPVAPDDAPVLN